RFGVEVFRQCLEGLGLENYQAAREFKRLSRPFAARQIAVEVSAGQRDYQRMVGMFTMKTFNRIVAAERMKRDEQVVRLALVALRDLHAMSEAPQCPRPPQRRDAVAMSRAWRRRSDNADLQDCGLRIADCGFLDCGLRTADCGLIFAGRRLASTFSLNLFF